MRPAFDPESLPGNDTDLRNSALSAPRLQVYFILHRFQAPPAWATELTD
ncbi:MAG: coenzyme A pyrophosphatase, partial [Cupriavidus sp.]|nr:coenzyme A pyrophosphatase [Cupriavidus sp.]